MNIKGNYYWLLLLIPMAFVAWYFINKNEQKPLRTLPYFGQKNSSKKGDTIFHTVKPFCFTNQYGEKVTEETIKEKIYVVDFFFTTCQSICPIMSDELERVYKQFSSRQDVLILSHTVAPEEDSVNVLMNYAKLHGVKNKQWLFLTGDKKHLYEMARQSYLLNAEVGNGGEEDFIHTQNFALVDKERHLRGFYDGTDSLEVSRLIIDINLLLEEYAYKEKHP
ncbi:MAG: SCO family protein [Burkholderiales bacterium]|nr:SCO family protein [Bacteroidia bacterium]